MIYNARSVIGKVETITYISFVVFVAVIVFSSTISTITIDRIPQAEELIKEYVEEIGKTSIEIDDESFLTDRTNDIRVLKVEDSDVTLELERYDSEGKKYIYNIVGL